MPGYAARLDDEMRHTPHTKPHLYRDTCGRHNDRPGSQRRHHQLMHVRERHGNQRTDKKALAHGTYKKHRRGKSEPP